MLKIDLDFKKGKWRTTYALLKTLMFKDAEYYITRNGVHVKIPSVKSTTELRMYFLDDENRIETDEVRKSVNSRFCDVLFDVKDSFSCIKANSVWEVLDCLKG